MAVVPRGRSFMADFKLPGRERVRLAFQTHAEALAYEMECRAAHALGKPFPDHKGGAVSQVKLQTIGALVEHCDKKRWARSPSRHGKLALRNAELYAEWCGPNLSVAAALTEEKIEEYCEHREAVFQNSGGTINRHLAAISVLVSEASRLKLIDTEPTLPKRKEGQARIRVFTQAEEDMILATCEQWGYQDLRSFFIFLADTGCRSGEVTKLTWADFDGDHIILEREITKNSTQRVLTMTPRVKAEIDELRIEHSTEPGPFTWVTERKIRTLWDRLRGHLPFMDEHTIPYTFRHTCLSRLVRAGIDLYRVQIWAGHKSPLMTQR